MSTGARRGAVFVDRDGVINELVPDNSTGLPESPLAPAEVALISGAAAALRSFAEAGWLLVGVSNQPAAAKGTVSLAQLQAVQTRVLQLLSDERVQFDRFQICLHHPDGVVAQWSGECACRKPAPGMLLDAAAQLHIDLDRSWMIGDTDTDILAGKAAGCQTVLIRNRMSVHKRGGDVQADVVVSNLAEATDAILHPNQVD